MSGLSDPEIKDMQNTAGGSVDPNSYQSLAQAFQQELEAAKGTRSRLQGLEQGQIESAARIGDTSQLPEGMSPTETITRGNMAATTYASQGAEAARGNILDVLSSMMSLKQQEEDTAYKQEQLKLAKEKQSYEMAQSGMTIDEVTGQPRGMTDAEREAFSMSKFDTMNDKDALAALEQVLNVRVGWTGTEAERANKAKRLLARLDAGENIDYKEVLDEDTSQKITAYLNANKFIDSALAKLEAEGKQTGKLQKAKFGIKSFFNRLTQEEADLANDLAQVAGDEAFGDAGKALTEIEKDIVDPKIITMGKSEAEVIAALKNAKQKISGKLESWTGGTVLMPEANTSSNKVKMVNPNGEVGYIPVDEKEEAISNGWKESQ